MNLDAKKQKNYGSNALVEKELNIVLSSALANGAVYKSPDGSSFNINFTEPISVPNIAINPKIQIVQAQFVNSFPNISSARNNNLFHFTYNAVQYVLTIPTGLYDIDTLNNELQNQLINLQLNTNIFELTGSSSTQKAIIVVNDPLLTLIDFTQVGSVGTTILGFNSQTIVPTFVPQVYTAQNTASFNSNNLIVVKSDLVEQGCRLNNEQSNILDIIPIDADIGFVINYSPQNSTILEAPQLKGNRSFVRVWIENEVGQALDTQGENYNLQIRISWQELLHSRHIVN